MWLGLVDLLVGPCRAWSFIALRFLNRQQIVSAGEQLHSVAIGQMVDADGASFFRSDLADCGGPPGSRSRHLGIKSARNDVSTGSTVSQYVLLSQVEGCDMRAAGDVLLHDEASCNRNCWDGSWEF